MTTYPSDVAFTAGVKAVQQEKGSRRGYARMERSGGWETTVTPELREYLSDRMRAWDVGARGRVRRRGPGWRPPHRPDVVTRLGREGLLECAIENRLARSVDEIGEED